MNKIEHQPSDPSALPNWNGSDKTRPLVEVTPGSPDDLVAIVRHPTEFPSPVRAAGHLHSTNPCFSTNVLDNVLGAATAREGTLVQMRPGFARIEVEVDPSDGEVYVRAGAGAQLIDIRDALWKCQPERELQVSPEIGNATIGSVACGGTKDATLPFTLTERSQISSLVVEAKIVDARGNKLRVFEGGAELIEGTDPPLRPDLRALRSSYGLFGIVYEVRVRTVPRIPIETRYEWLPFPSKRPRPDEIPDVAAVFGGAQGVLGFLQPYHGGLLVERRTHRPGAKVRTQDSVRRAIRDWIWEWGVSQATTAAEAIKNPDPGEVLQRLIFDAIRSAADAATPNRLERELARLGIDPAAPSAFLSVLGISATLPPTMTKAFSKFAHVAQRVVGTSGGDIYDRLLQFVDEAPRLVFGALRGFTAHRSDSMLDFAQPPDRGTTFDFTFWLFPERQWRKTMSAYLNFCQDDLAATRFRPTLFTQVYFMGADQSSLLSPCPEPAFSLDVAHTGSVDMEPWKQFNHRYNLWAAEHGGRPLLNQTKHLESTPDVKKDVLDKAFGGTWAEFSRLVWQANPAVGQASDNRFVSDFFRRLLHPR